MDNDKTEMKNLLESGSPDSIFGIMSIIKRNLDQFNDTRPVTTNPETYNDKKEPL